jgi:multiple sugar transport system permease protein
MLRQPFLLYNTYVENTSSEERAVKKLYNKILPYMLLLPMLILMIALVYYPIAVTFSYSLKKMKLTRPNDVEFIGLKNYIEILKSEDFLYSLQNTLFLLIFVVILTTVFGFALALILNREHKLSGLFLAIAILPWAMPPIVNGIIWKFIFFPGYGFINKLFIALGLTEKPIDWLSDRSLLLMVVSVVTAWRSAPFCGIVCLAGLKTIPKELYESAAIDGSGTFSSFRHITLPLSLPFIGIGMTSASVTAVNIFDEIVSLSGFSDTGKNLLIQNYLTTFSFLDFGRGSALTYIIMILTSGIGVLYLRSLNKEVSYQ